MPATAGSGEAVWSAPGRSYTSSTALASNGEAVSALVNAAVLVNRCAQCSIGIHNHRNVTVMPVPGKIVRSLTSTAGSSPPFRLLRAQYNRPNKGHAIRSVSEITAG